MEQAPPVLVGTVEAAAAIGVSYRTLQRYVANGRVRPTVSLPSGHYRWDVTDLREQLNPSVAGGEPCAASRSGDGGGRASR